MPVLRGDKINGRTDKIFVITKSGCVQLRFLNAQEIYFVGKNSELKYIF